MPMVHMNNVHPKQQLVLQMCSERRDVRRARLREHCVRMFGGMVTALKRAIVTGAAGVIGSAACRRLLHDEYRVVGIDHDEAAGDRLVKELDAGDRFCFVSADVSSEPDVERYVEVAKNQLGGVD